jgi:hypothetical protein
MICMPPVTPLSRPGRRAESAIRAALAGYSRLRCVIGPDTKPVRSPAVLRAALLLTGVICGARTNDLRLTVIVVADRRRGTGALSTALPDEQYAIRL